MAKKTVEEIFCVTVQIDTPYPDDRRVRPRSVEFDSLDQAADAVKRAMSLPCSPGDVTVMVSRELREDEGGPDDPNLEDWPSERHIVTGEMTAEDF